MTTDTPATFESRDMRELVGYGMTRRAAQSGYTAAGIGPQDVDVVELGERAFYHRRVTALASRSRMSKIVGSPVYPRLTLRNWRTTTTLAGMLRG